MMLCGEAIIQHKCGLEQRGSYHTHAPRLSRWCGLECTEHLRATEEILFVFSSEEISLHCRKAFFFPACPWLPPPHPGFREKHSMG